ncbi:MAG: right-handed parallel beta-helix repeat-containing protein, partial [Planctomycetota bacterium]
MKTAKIGLFIGLVLGLLVLVGPVGGAELPVPGQYATIQTAIDAASDGDTVVVAPGRYVENIDYKGKAITVRSSEPGDWDVVENTIIDGSAGDPRENGNCVLFDKGEGRTSILDGITLTRGTGGRAQYDDRSLGKGEVHAGGGILCLDSSPTIRRCIIKDNGLVGGWEPVGGGIAILGNCKAVVSNCIIVHNTGEGYLGRACGIFIRSHNPETAISTIRNCTIAHNRPDSWEEWTYQVNCSNTRTRICNTIIWNEACEGHPDCESYWGNGHTRSLLMKDVSPVTHSCVNNAYTYVDDALYAERTDLTLFGGNIDEWPGFVGPYIEAYPNEADYHLLASSVCVNAGDPNFVGEAGEMDIDGEARV